MIRESLVPAGATAEHMIVWGLGRSSRESDAAMSFSRFIRHFFPRLSRRGAPISVSPHPLKHCPTCGSRIEYRGIGGITPKGLWSGRETICPRCGPVELEDPSSPDNDAAPIAVTPDPDGWARCPCCGFRFSTTTAYAYRYGRHRRCGQRLVITNIDASGNA